MMDYGSWIMDTVLRVWLADMSTVSESTQSARNLAPPRQQQS